MSELKTDSRILMIGIGNNGRSDDALGWKFVDEFSNREDLFDIEHRYQLQIEDALLFTEYKKVIFVDASHKEYEKGYSFYKCIPARTEAKVAFTQLQSIKIILCIEKKSLYNEI